MNANWWGLVGENLTKIVGRISKTSEVISGIPGSGADQDGVPYSLTEEFTSVYRMHSLIPGKDLVDGLTHETRELTSRKIISRSLTLLMESIRRQFHLIR